MNYCECSFYILQYIVTTLQITRLQIYVILENILHIDGIMNVGSLLGTGAKLMRSLL